MNMILNANLYNKNMHSFLNELFYNLILQFFYPLWSFVKKDKRANAEIARKWDWTQKSFKIVNLGDQQMKYINDFLVFRSNF